MASSSSDGRDRAFIAAVRDAAAIDPMPTLHQLARNVGLTPDEIIHYILVQWASSGSEALMATSPLALRQLKAAADAGDVDRMLGIVSWLLSGWQEG